ncbi:MAG TPA: hypothetical protein VFL13_02530 [Candidatus Baltobacteraceae bacterium]|nr:hypothetical protein [Candidatus Baltobacteraceae bacterium]
MKHLAWGLALLAGLSACDSAQAGNFHEHVHRSISAANVRTLRVETSAARLP